MRLNQAGALRVVDAAWASPVVNASGSPPTRRVTAVPEVMGAAGERWGARRHSHPLSRSARPCALIPSRKSRLLRLEALRLVLLDVGLELRRVHRVVGDEQLRVRLGRGNRRWRRRVGLRHSLLACAGPGAILSTLAALHHVLIGHQALHRPCLARPNGRGPARKAVWGETLPSLRRFREHALYAKKLQLTFSIREQTFT